MTKTQLVLVLALICCLGSGFGTAQETDADIDKANAYDNAWEPAWVSHLRVIHQRAQGKTDGFVIHLGDSITCAPMYGSFAANYRSGTPLSKTVEWSKGGAGTIEGEDVPPDCKNGWALAGYRFPDLARSYTASCGMTAKDLLDYAKNGLASGKNDKAPLDTLLTNTHTGPHPDSVEGYRVAVISDACLAVLMLGTNDIWQNHPPDQVIPWLRKIIVKLEAADIMVIISTIPPFKDKDAGVDALNTGIRALAQEMQLPLIDFFGEIKRRRPGDTWQNTLMGEDGIHPSWNGYRDPVSSAMELSRNGYSLRGFLSVCKIQEVRAYVYDGVNPAGFSDKASGAPPACPAITTAILPDAAAGQPYTLRFEVAGGTAPYTWKGISLPRGFRLSAEGELTGVSARAATYKLMIKVTDADKQVDRASFTLNIR